MRSVQPEAMSAGSLEQLVDRDPRVRAIALVEAVRSRVRAQAVLLVAVTEPRGAHSPLAATGYDNAAVDYLASERFTRECARTRRQLADATRLFDWNDDAAHSESFAVQGVLMPRGFRNGMSMPLFRDGALVGACHVSFSRPVVGIGDKQAFAQLRSALGSVASAGSYRRLALLTPREQEILMLVRDGMSNVQIARALQLSPRTVGTHVEHILHKLECTNRVGAAIWAERNLVA